MKPYTRISLGLFTLAILIVSFNNCSQTKFQADPSAAIDKLKSGDIIVGNPMTQSSKTIVSGICSVLMKCRPNLSQADCESGVLKAPGIDYQIGLQKGTYTNLSEVQQSEISGSLKGNFSATNACQYAIANLTCEDPSVQKAYDSALQDPFLNVASMIPTAPGSCPAIFNQPVQKEFYVSTTGSDSNDGSVEKPWATITHAASALTLGPQGTVVHVAPGNYTPPLITDCYSSSSTACAIQTAKSGTASAPIVFISDVQWGAKIQSAGAYTIWHNSGSYVSIVGFELIGDASTNIGISNHAAYTQISGNNIHHIPVTAACSNGNGGAGISHSNTADVHDNDTVGNIIHDIGPLPANGLIASSYCSEAHGIAYRQVRGKIQNNLIYRIATWGVYTWRSASELQITNNLIFNSGARDSSGGFNGGGILIAAESTAPAMDNTTVTNNIIRNNSGSAVVEGGHTGTHNLYANNIVYANGRGFSLQNGLTASGTINADPQMVDFKIDGSGNYKLLSNSPAIDAGSLNCASSIGGNCTPQTDHQGLQRPLGSAIDIGPFEFRP